MEALAWAIVFTVCVFDYRSAEDKAYFTKIVAWVSIVMLYLLTAVPWLT